MITTVKQTTNPQPTTSAPIIVQLMPPSEEADPLEEQMQTLRNRKTKLEELIALQQSVLKLENRLLLGKDDLSRRTRIIGQVVCDHYGITVALMLGPSREDHLLFSRYMAMHLARKLFDSTFVAIGELFGRDHGTVINACRKVKDLIDTDKCFASDLVKIEAECREKLDAVHLLPA
jgi:chromosomal replication initiation ATPase DnaA